MPAIKDVGSIASKFARVTPQRQQEYQEGVQNPRRSWQSATVAAKERHREGVQKALQRDAFAKGVAAAGDSKWQSRAVSVGPSRFAEGARQAEDAYAQGFAPYAQVISSTTLPPRYAKGDPRNIERAAAMAKALRSRKEQG